MGQELVIVPAGLYTDPSPHGAAPPGALRTATNVVLRRAGAVEPRPGFFQDKARPDVNLALVHAILGYAGYPSTVIYVGEAQATHTTYMTDGGPAIAVTMDSGGALPWTRGHIQAAATRKNLYLSTADAVRKITSNTDTTASKAGTPPCLLELSAGTSPGTAVPAGKAVSYRAVVVRTDANGVVVRSAPSNRVIYRNVGAVTQDPGVLIILSSQDDNAGSGNTVELYRSLAVEQDETPFDDHFLAKPFVGGLMMTGNDDVAQEDLGAALYTNDDEEGAAAANVRPPQAKDVAEFNGSLFLANLTYPAQRAVNIPYVTNLLATDAAGVGQRTLTGTFTNGSAVVTGVASTVGFRVGQIIDESLNEWAGTTDLPRIISLTASSVTFSANYTGTTGSKSKAVYDSIRVNSQYFPVGSSSWASAIRGFWEGGIFGTHTPATSVYALTEDVVTVLSTGQVSSGANRNLLLKAINPTTSPFVVYATHGSEYRPALPEPTATGLAATQDVFPSGVAWSKTFEPEHFSLVDMEQIGSDIADTWRIKRGRDALWILKTDGLWRLSGAGRDAGFRIDPVSRAKLVNPNCVADIFDQVYAWTDQGILALDSGANAVQSHPVRDQLVRTQATAGQGIGPFATWLCSNQKANELLVNIGQRDSTSYLLVYNFLTNAWTRWDLSQPPSCGGAPNDALIFGLETPLSVDGDMQVSIRELSSGLFDLSYMVNVTAIAGNAITIAAGSGWTPKVGDIINLGSMGGPDPVIIPSSVVTAVTDATHFTVLLQPSPLTGSQRAYPAYPCVIEPVACTSKNPSILKLWGDGSLLWGKLSTLLGYTVSFTSSISQTVKSAIKTLDTAPPKADCSHRFIVPREHARTEQVFVQTTVRQAILAYEGTGTAANWIWQGLSLFHSAMGPRVRAR